MCKKNVWMNKNGEIYIYKCKLKKKTTLESG